MLNTKNNQSARKGINVNATKVGKLVEKYFDSVIAVIDKELTDDQINHIVCKHEDLKTMSFDAIIITALNRENSIIRFLSKFCPRHKIVTFEI